MDTRNPIIQRNAAVYDAMAAQGHPLCRPATADELSRPLATIDPSGWMGGSIVGRRVLCLAAGGGRHSQLYLAAGAIVTVVDVSSSMLKLDQVNSSAIRDGSLRVVQTSMDEMPMLDSAGFDIVVQPVSTCYLRDLKPMFAEVARVLRPDGLYISQHKSPVNLQTSTRPNQRGHYEVRHGYYERSPVTQPARNTPCTERLREPGAIEFVHRLETIFGGICRHGFVIEDVREPDHHDDQSVAGSFSHRANWIAPYLRIKARRSGAGWLL